MQIWLVGVFTATRLIVSTLADALEIEAIRVVDPEIG